MGCDTFKRAKSGADVAIFSDQLVKARVVPITRIIVPWCCISKRRYITDEIFGFSLEELISLNIKHRPVFAIGW